MQTIHDYEEILTRLEMIESEIHQLQEHVLKLESHPQDGFIIIRPDTGFCYVAGSETRGREAAALSAALGWEARGGGGERDGPRPRYSLGHTGWARALATGGTGRLG